VTLFEKVCRLRLCGRARRGHSISSARDTWVPLFRCRPPRRANVLPAEGDVPLGSPDSSGVLSPGPCQRGEKCKSYGLRLPLG
jgi:hypothetical protein